MDNPIYKIKVEVIGEEGENKVDQSLVDGVECSGFTIIAQQDDGCVGAIHAVSKFELAKDFSSSGTLMAAAHLGKALREAAKMEAEDERHSIMSKLTEKLMADMGIKKSGDSED